MDKERYSLRQRVKGWLPNRADRDWKMVPENLTLPGPHLRVRPWQIIGGRTWSLSLLLNQRMERQ